MSGRRLWRTLVPVVCLAAGVGFAVSARDSQGTDLRSPADASLVDLIHSAQLRVQEQDATVQSLHKHVDELTEAAGDRDAAVAAARAQNDALRAPAGLTAVTGTGVIVTLDDAPADVAAEGVDPNQLLVHQSDLQSVVNALWAGGAQAMTIAGQRVIATSAVRCVGNTLLLNGAVYSPPYSVAAIGPSGTMLKELDASRGVALFKQAAEYYGLGYTVTDGARLNLPAYVGSPTLSYAKPLEK